MYWTKYNRSFQTDCLLFSYSLKCIPFFGCIDQSVTNTHLTSTTHRVKMALPAGEPFMMNLVDGGWLIRCVCTASQLKLADLIGDSEKSSEELAKALEASEDFTFRRMRITSHRFTFFKTCRFICSFTCSCLRGNFRGGLC